MSTSTEPSAHRGHQFVGDQFGCLGPHDQDGADDDVGVYAGLLDGVGARGHRLQRAPEVVVDPAESLEVPVEDVHLGVHAHRQGGRGHARHAGAQDHDLGAADTGDPAHQDATSAPGAHQMVGTHQRGHPTGHLAHRGEQRKRVVGQTYGLIGDGRVPGGQQRFGAGRDGGQVQVGEEDLTLAEPEARVLLLDRFLHPEDHVGLGPHLHRVVHDLGPGGDELGVGYRGADSGASFDIDDVAGSGELAHAGRGDCHPVLVRLDLLGDPDDHQCAPSVTVQCRADKTSRDGIWRHGTTERSVIVSRMPNRPTSVPRSAGTRVLVDLLRVSPRKKGGRTAAIDDHQHEAEDQGTDIDQEDASDVPVGGKASSTRCNC